MLIFWSLIVFWLFYHSSLSLIPAENINPYIPSWGHIWSFSEHIHASDKYISSFISVRSFTGKVRVKEKNYCAEFNTLKFISIMSLLSLIIKFIMILKSNVFYSSSCSKAFFVRIHLENVNFSFHLKSLLIFLILVNIPIKEEKQLFWINRFLLKNQTYHHKVS